MLNEYHATLGSLVFQFEGTLERFTGDGLLVFFNDPVPCDDAPCQSDSHGGGHARPSPCIAAGWERRGHDLGFGAGIAQGYATLGRIGFEGRYDYAAIGSVTNQAARLCAAATDSQILVSHRVLSGAGDIAITALIGQLDLPGFSRPVRTFNIKGIAQPDASPERPK